MKRAISVMLSLLLALGAMGTALAWGPDDLVATLGDFSAYGAGDIEKYEEPIDMTIGISINLNKYFPEGDSYADNVWSRLYKEALGIKLHLAFTTSDLADKVNTMIAAGDIPDVLQVSKAQLALLAESGLIRDDLYEVYEQHAGAGMRELVQGVGGKAAIESCTFDGKMMALPMMDTSSGEATPVLWLRTDWLEKLGLENPKNWEDLKHIMVAFATQDPDGNGVDDTYGIVFQKSLWANAMMMDGFFNIFGAYPENNFWVDDPENEGRVMYGAFAPEVKAGLAQLHELYAQGVLHPEFAIMDTAAASAVYASGKCGVAIAVPSATNQPGLLAACVENDPAADWRALPIPGLDGETTRVTATYPVRNYLVFRKDFEHPEAIVKMINYRYQMCFSDGATQEIYDEYIEDSSGTNAYTAFSIYPWGYFMPAVKNERAATIIAGGMKADDPAMPNYATAFARWCEAYEAGERANWRWYRFFGPEGGHQVTSRYIAEDLYYLNRFFGPDTPTMTENMSLITDLVSEMIVKIVMGEAPLDEFERYREKADALGLEQITDEVNAWLAQNQI